MGFRLKHEEGRLVAFMTVDGVEHKEDVTEYMSEEEETAEWLFYKRRKRREEDRLMDGRDLNGE